MDLHTFNNTSKPDVAAQLRQCCGASNWVDQMTEHHPYADANTLLEKAIDIWYNHCSRADYLEAFSHHPRIGDVQSLAEKFPETGQWAAQEQAAVKDAHRQILQQLADLNEKYFQQFGYTFIVCATGKSAAEMLELLKRRMQHNPSEELQVALNEQFKITLIRLDKLMDWSDGPVLRNSHITTHVLDTSLGKPGKNISIRLKEKVNGNWHTRALGITNEDGRIPDLLPPGVLLSPGPYQMHFDTESYFDHQNILTFYPEVAIHFTIFDDSHYHVPLLVNPFGYSTYRGS